MDHSCIQHSTDHSKEQSWLGTFLSCDLILSHRVAQDAPATCVATSTQRRGKELMAYLRPLKRLLATSRPWSETPSRWRPVLYVRKQRIESEDSHARYHGQDERADADSVTCRRATERRDQRRVFVRPVPALHDVCSAQASRAARMWCAIDIDR